MTRFEAVNPSIVLEPARRLMWTHTLGNKAINFAAAEKLVAKLNKARHGGFDNWRLPTVEEAFLLADRTRHHPAIDTAFFADTQSDWYWTASPDASGPDSAWFVSFNYGNAYLGHRSYDAFVRAVRSVPASAPGQ